MESIPVEMQLIPFIPVFPSSISILDLVLPVALLALSLLLHILFNSPPPRTATLSAHIYRATTAHARFLPAVAKHVFSYPLLIFGFDLDALERGDLDMELVFRWESSKRALTSMSRRGYLYVDGEAEAGGLREKLMRCLEERGERREEIGRVYLVTMPSYLGFQGINPLSVYYCYDVEDEQRVERRLKIVVLEVHNTFGERHVYVMRCGQEEDDKVAVSYEHQWTFPRAFHVSPFNDRTGFYCVSLSDPLLRTPTSPTWPSVPSPALPSHPVIHLKIVFLTPEREKKLYASLSGTGEPMDQWNVLRALSRWPFSLLLTTPRILLEAAKLHYARRLDVFPRPEPFITATSMTGMEEVNPVEKGAKAGGVGWQEEGGIDILAREKTIEILERRVEELSTTEGRNVHVVFQSADQSKRDIVISPAASSTSTSPLPAEELTISYLTPAFFTDLLTTPSIQLALEIGSNMERRWSTSNDELFLHLFKSTAPPRSIPSTPLSRLLARLSIRLLRSQMLWGLSYASATSSTLPAISSSLESSHPFFDCTSSTRSSFLILRTIALHFFILRLGAWLFSLTGAQFVKGRETWGEWARWSERNRMTELDSTISERGKVEHGSVVRGRIAS